MALNEFDIEVEGLEELDARMEAFPAEFNRACARDGVEAMCVYLAGLAQDNAPVMTEAFGKREPGELRDSIGVIMEDVRANNPTYTSGLVTPIYDGGGQESPGVWGKFVEYGSVHNPDPKPFLRPAVDGGAAEAIDICVRVTGESLDKLPGGSSTSEAA
jgi:hypothetical protein